MLGLCAVLAYLKELLQVPPEALHSEGLLWAYRSFLQCLTPANISRASTVKKH